MSSSDIASSVSSDAALPRLLYSPNSFSCERFKTVGENAAKHPKLAAAASLKKLVKRLLATPLRPIARQVLAHHTKFAEALQGLPKEYQKQVLDKRVAAVKNAIEQAEAVKGTKSSKAGGWKAKAAKGKAAKGKSATKPKGASSVLDLTPAMADEVAPNATKSSPNATASSYHHLSPLSWSASSALPAQMKSIANKMKSHHTKLMQDVQDKLKQVFSEKVQKFLDKIKAKAGSLEGTHKTIIDGEIARLEEKANKMMK